MEMGKREIWFYSYALEKVDAGIVAGGVSERVCVSMCIHGEVLCAVLHRRTDKMITMVLSGLGI